MNATKTAALPDFRVGFIELSSVWLRTNGESDMPSGLVADLNTESVSVRWGEIGGKITARPKTKLEVRNVA